MKEDKQILGCIKWLFLMNGSRPIVLPQDKQQLIEVNGGLHLTVSKTVKGTLNAIDLGIPMNSVVSIV